LPAVNPRPYCEFMDKVEEFINQEETLLAIIGSRQTQVSTPKNPEKKKKRNPKGEQATEAKPLKQFKDYNFMLLNASIHEVLMEVRKDLDYVRPPRITRNTSDTNKDKYCAFHNANRHGTEGFIALRIMIEKFIWNGKLVRFLAEHRTQPRQNRD
jgi:hypothetical protein